MAHRQPRFENSAGSSKGATSDRSYLRVFGKTSTSQPEGTSGRKRWPKWCLKLVPIAFCTLLTIPLSFEDMGIAAHWFAHVHQRCRSLEVRFRECAAPVPSLTSGSNHCRIHAMSSASHPTPKTANLLVAGDSLSVVSHPYPTSARGESVRPFFLCAAS